MKSPKIRKDNLRNFWSEAKTNSQFEVAFVWGMGIGNLR